MFTRKRFRPPSLTGDDQKDLASLGKAIVDYLQSLEDKNSLSIDSDAAKFSDVTVNGAAGTGAPAPGPGTVYVRDTDGASFNGGAILFGASQGFFAGIKGEITNGSGNTSGRLSFYTRALTTDANLTKGFTLNEDGHISGPGLSGTYTPTLTGIVNVDSVSGGVAKWSRTGNMVDVSGTLTIDATAAANTFTSIGVSLPVPSNLASASDLTGQCWYGNGSGGGPNYSGSASGDATNDRAQLDFPSGFVVAATLAFRFQYEVKQ